MIQFKRRDLNGKRKSRSGGEVEGEGEREALVEFFLML